MNLRADVVAREIASLKATHPDIFDDDELRELAIESETSTLEFLSHIVRRIEEAEILTDGIAVRVAELNERKARLGRRVDGLRSVIFDIMEAADLRKAILPTATLSIADGKPKVIITDEKLLPAQYYETEIKPKKKEIGDALKAKQEVPGAVLSNAESVLSIRTK